MPIYDYKCERCGYVFEVSHPMNEEPVVFCPDCKTGTNKIITGGTGFIMKDSHSGSAQKDTDIRCGRRETCCGRSNPCDTRPCDK